MSSVPDLIEPAAKVFFLAEATARYFLLSLLVIGAIGWFTARTNSRRALRFRGMVGGSVAALMVIFGLTTLYDVIVLLVGSQFLPPGWPYGVDFGTGGSAAMMGLAAGISGLLHYLGLAIFSLGAAVWAAAGSKTTRNGKRGYTGVLVGLAMVGLSLGGQLFTAFAYIFGV